MIQIPDKILTSFPKLSSSVTEHTGEYKIIPSQSLREVYFPEGFNMMELSITLSDWGVASFTSRHLTENIQPVLLRAPEVLLQAEWNAAVDIWNLGALVPELVFAQRMFCARDGEGVYEVKRHLEEMEGLCGKFPKAFLKKGDRGVVDGVFDWEGELRERELEEVVSLEKRFEGLDAGERENFVAFIKRMLVLDPEERPSAKELLEEAWLKHNYDEDVSEEQ
jgi:serine/threonine-protein kinase SRPK3